MNDQLDATVTILLIFESAQHISGNFLPVFRSLRLWFYRNNTPYCCKTAVLRSWRWAKNSPKYVELIQRSIKLLLLHLFGHLYYSPILMMHCQTQIKFVCRKSRTVIEENELRLCNRLRISSINYRSWWINISCLVSWDLPWCRDNQNANTQNGQIMNLRIDSFLLTVRKNKLCYIVIRSSRKFIGKCGRTG